MSEVKWIKLSVAIFDDEKIRLIEKMPSGDSLLVVWIKLLTLAGQKNMRGQLFLKQDIPYNDEMLATIFNREVTVINLALNTLQSLGMIEMLEDRKISIVNWDKHQNVEGMERIRLLNNQRQKRLRDRRKSINLLEPGPTRNVMPNVSSPPEIKNTEKEEEREREGEAEREEKQKGAPSESTHANGPYLTVIVRTEAEATFRKIAEEYFGEPITGWYGTRMYEEALSEAITLPRDQFEALQWLYSLPRDDVIFWDRKHLAYTRRRKYFATLLKNVRAEGQKAFFTRRAFAASLYWTWRARSDCPLPTCRFRG